MKSILTFCIVLCTLSLSAQHKTVLPVAQEVLEQFPNVRDFTISTGEDEAYFTALSPMGELSFIIEIRKSGNQWTLKIASFSGQYTDLEPFLSSDGLKLYFASNRPKTQRAQPADFDIWYVQRNSKTSPWSSPINAGATINSSDSEFYPAITDSGNLYFTLAKTGSDSKDDIYVSKWDGQKFSTPSPLGNAVNSTGYEFNAYVSPDESFVIFSGYGRADGFGQGDLYISRKDANGNWVKAENLGPKINSNKLDYCPYVNPVTNTLYFTSKRGEVKRPKDGFTDASAFLKEINKYQNGLSRIYKVTLDK